ncbi:MAG TPA: ATP-binding protein, partial [Desulfuromonadales bacterium]|nr:ATP-binding protein [Desulfuromonadales bacterium]
GLRRNEQEWVQTFEAITDAVAILDLKGRVMKKNRAAEEFLSVKEGEALDESGCRLLTDLTDPDADCPFANMLRSKSPEFGEMHSQKSDRYFHIGAYPLADTSGELWGGVLLIQDITEQKRLEHAKDEMLSSVSHEMRTPLTAMLGFIEFLLENEVDKEQERDFLQTVLSETRRLNDLISNFLDLQRLAADLENYRIEPCDITDLLKESAHFFALASKKHNIVVDCPEYLPKGMGDVKRLQQVMKNLLSNAIKYSPGGGSIVLNAYVKKNEIVVSVKDEGMGIPQQALGKIFSRFYRVDDSDRRIPGGIGLGLALVKEMIKAHGGRVWAESTLGKGSTFYFTLPLAPSGDSKTVPAHGEKKA